MSRPLSEVFPFEYQGGGYFRRKGVPKGEVADTLHGQQAIEYIYNEMIKPTDGYQCDGCRTLSEMAHWQCLCPSATPNCIGTTIDITPKPC